MNMTTNLLLDEQLLQLQLAALHQHYRSQAQAALHGAQGERQAKEGEHPGPAELGQHRISGEVPRHDHDHHSSSTTYHRATANK